MLEVKTERSVIVGNREKGHVRNRRTQENIILLGKLVHGEIVDISDQRQKNK